MNVLIVLVAAHLAMPATAQDIPSPYSDAIAQGAQRQLDDTLARRRLEQAGARQRDAVSRATRERQRRACANLPRFAAQHGRNHPKVVQLTGWCRRDGYIR